MTKIRTGQVPAPLTREQFHERYLLGFYDPAFAGEHEAIARLEEIAWQAMQEGRKAPITRVAGRGFADPTYEISVQWLDTRKRLRLAQKRWQDMRVVERRNHAQASSLASNRAKLADFRWRRRSMGAALSTRMASILSS